MPSVKLSRRERAARTRATIVETAYRLLVERGWEATTMQAVADEAGFAVQTIYFVFGTKAALVAAVEEYAIAGGASPSGFLGEWFTRAGKEEDAGALIRLFVETDTLVKSRLAPLVAALGGHLQSELAGARDRESGRERFFGMLIDRLAELGVLKPDLSRDRALDILRAMNALATYADLTRRRGWSDVQWIDWMTDVLISQITSIGPAHLSSPQ